MAVVDKSKAVAIITLTVLLCVSGGVIFFWMAATNWSDITGVAVATIFIGFGIIQAVFVLFWWRLSASSEDKDWEKKPQELQVLKPITPDQTLTSSPLLAPNGKDTPMSLRSDASSVQPLGARAFDVSGSIPYVDATSQSESSLA